MDLIFALCSYIFVATMIKSADSKAAPLSGTARDNGCWHEGQKVKMYQKVVSGDQWKQCTYTPDGKSTKMEPFGCVDSKGKTFEWGQKFTDGDSAYYCRCSLDTGLCYQRVYGCVERGKIYTSYQMIEMKDGSVWRCIVPVSKESKKAIRKLTGCMSNTYQGRETKRINCTWDEGRVPFQYVKKCAKDGDSARIETLACLYKGKAEVRPGCFNIVGTGQYEGAGCSEKPGSGSLEIKVLGYGTREEIIRKGRAAGFKPACWMISQDDGYSGSCC